jgi:hypothetical protein
MDFRIVFSGRLREGADPAVVRQRLGQALKLTDPARLESLFSGAPVVLKKGVLRDEAVRYQEALLRIGLITECQPMAAGGAPAPAPLAASVPAPPPAAAASTVPGDEPQFGRLSGLKLAAQGDLADDEPEVDIPPPPRRAAPALLVEPALTPVPAPAPAPVSPPSAPSPAHPPAHSRAHAGGWVDLSLVPIDEGVATAAAEPTPEAAAAGSSLAMLTSRTGIPVVAPPPPPPPPVKAPGPRPLPQTDTAAGTEVYRNATRHVDRGDGRWDPAFMPEEARGLCWGGFFLPFIWGSFNGFKLALLPLLALRVLRYVLPGWGLLAINFGLSSLVLVKGREFAWQNKSWRGVEHFNRVQRNWAIGGLLGAVLIWGIVIYIVVTAAAKAKALEADYEAQARREKAEMQADPYAQQEAQREKDAQAREAYLNSISDPVEREKAREEMDAADARREQAESTDNGAAPPP